MNDLPLRQSGRTTRMLEDAVRLASEGKKVLVVVASHHRTDIKNQVWSMTGKLRNGGEVFDNIQITDETRNIDFKTWKSYGFDPWDRMLVDHYVIEVWMGAAFEHWTEYIRWES